MKQALCLFLRERSCHPFVGGQGFAHHIIHTDSSFYKLNGKDLCTKGTYLDNRVTKYAPLSGRIPEAPEGFITFLLWIDSNKLKGAPYTEALWFLTTNDTGPENHSHEDLDEFIAFIGSDPEHPEELNGEISFIGDEQIFVTKHPYPYTQRRSQPAAGHGLISR